MVALPYPTAENVTTIAGLFRYGDIVTEGAVVSGILFTIWIIVVIHMIAKRSNQTWDIAMSAGFFVAVLAIIMRIFNVLQDDSIMFICIASCVIPMVIKLLTDR